MQKYQSTFCRLDNFSDTQVTRKRVTPTRGGVVASAHKRAAQAGVAVLEAGGDALDAAVATSFALGVVEPWMSGIAAGGCMVLWRAKGGRAHGGNYGMRPPPARGPRAPPPSRRGQNTPPVPPGAGGGRPPRAGGPPA